MEFHVVPGTAVTRILTASRPAILDLVAETYLAHERGETVQPPSGFLRFPGRPRDRVIALPGYLGGAVNTVGIKWIASVPANTGQGRPRASAVLILNDAATGYPVACLEAAGISAARTAASAACTAKALVRAPGTVGFVGAGVIARTIADYLAAADIPVTDALVHDTDPASAELLASRLKGRIATRRDTLAADVVVFATTATTPHVHTPLRPGQLILHISLRDLAPELLLSANNVLDDVAHCLTANTSAHLAAQRTGGSGFVTGTIGALLRGELHLDPGKPTVVSPFGLGVLDIAVGAYVLATALGDGSALPIPGFFGETTRW